MWGRAGRRGRGLAIYVAGEDALDQFFCRHPDEFLERPVEAAILDHENEQLYAAHLLCAAHEAPLEAADADVLGPALARGRRRARRRRRPARAPRRHVRPAPRRTEYPAGDVLAAQRVPRRRGDRRHRLRRGDRRRRRRAARPRPSTRARSTCTAGASSRSPRSTYDDRRALVRPFDGDWYTQPKRETDTQIERRARASATALGVRLCFGTVVVSEQVLAYQRRRLSDHEADRPDRRSTSRAPRSPPRRSGTSSTSTADLDCSARCTPPSTRRSPSCRCWRCATAGTSAGSRPTTTTQTGGPTIFIYDGHPGGIGIARRGFEAFERLVDDAHRLVSECPCESGCPSCVQSPKCGNLNEPLVEGRLRGADGRDAPPLRQLRGGPRVAA